MSDFGSEMQAAVTKAAVELERVRKLVTYSLFSSIIDDTPVDTGQLRGNWITSIGSPILLDLPGKLDPSGITTKAEAYSIVYASHQGQVLFMANSLDYAYSIEYDGKSRYKAPEGMVRKNLNRFNADVKLSAFAGVATP